MALITLRQPLYDSVKVSRHNSVYNLFCEPVGWSDPPKGLSDTNMARVNGLPLRHEFLIESIELLGVPRGAKVSFEFMIDGRIFLQAPQTILELPGGMSLGKHPLLLTDRSDFRGQLRVGQSRNRTYTAMVVLRGLWMQPAG